MEKRIDDLYKLIKDPRATDEAVLDAYASIAFDAFPPAKMKGDAGTTYASYTLEAQKLERLPSDDTERKATVNFFHKLGQAKLERAQVPTIEIVEEDGFTLDWQDVSNTWKSFLPDNTAHQVLVAEMFAADGTDPSPLGDMDEDEAFGLCEFGLVDMGDVLWKITVEEGGKTHPGSPLAADRAGPDYIMREHHRQVYFNALSWLYSNASAALTPGPNTPATVVGATGTPGIGKSRCLVPLMWFLLQQKTAFLLESGSIDDRIYVLVRPRTKTVEFLSLKKAREAARYDHSILCLIDPKQFPKEHQGRKVEPSELMMSRSVVVFTPPSGDPAHLRRGDKEECITARFCVSPWKLIHCLAVRKIFSVRQMSASEVKERFSIVGGVPRALFHGGTFDALRNIVKDASVDKIVDDLYKVVIADGDNLDVLLVRKFPQAFLALFCDAPFRVNFGGDRPNLFFLSREGQKRAGVELYRKYRHDLAKCEDRSTAGMFFERWVGTFLASDQGKNMPFKLCLFNDGIPEKTSVVTTPGGGLLRFKDEAVLLTQLPQVQKGDVSSVVTLFRKGSVFEPPANTPVYDFALNSRQFIQATLALYHPLSKTQAANLVSAVGASPMDPLHLFFFVGHEQHAVQYSKRAGGESFEGETGVQLSSAQINCLKQNATANFSDDKLIAIANQFGIDCPKTQKRMRGDTTLLETGKVRAPVKATSAILGKLKLSKAGAGLEVRWERLVNFASSLDGQGLTFDPKSVVQHVIALMPHEPAL